MRKLLAFFSLANLPIAICYFIYVLLCHRWSIHWNHFRWSCPDSKRCHIALKPEPGQPASSGHAIWHTLRSWRRIAAFHISLAVNPMSVDGSESWELGAGTGSGTGIQYFGILARALISGSVRVSVMCFCALWLSPSLYCFLLSLLPCVLWRAFSAFQRLLLQPLGECRQQAIFKARFWAQQAWRRALAHSHSLFLRVCVCVRVCRCRQAWILAQ